MRTAVLLLALLGITCAFSQAWVGLNYAAGTGECELDACATRWQLQTVGLRVLGRPGKVILGLGRGHSVERLVQHKAFSWKICPTN
jgi:hypothetical protein